jgi:predicted transcriptional regulator
MRTTIDLPDDVHQAAVQIARDRGQTLSRTVAGLLRVALAAERGGAIEVDQESGLPTVHAGRMITADDVAAAADDG